MNGRDRRTWLVVGLVAVVGVLPLGFLAWKFIPWFDPYSGVFSQMGLDDDMDIITESQSGERYQLRDFVPFEWDTVSVFPEYTSSEVVQEEIGVDIVRGSRFHNSRFLMVFCQGGNIVDVHYYPYANLVSIGTYSQAVMVRGGLLVEPSGNPVEPECG